MKKRLLQVITSLTKEKENEYLTAENTPFTINNLPEAYLSQREILEQMGIESELLYALLDELELDGHIYDHSKSNMSWGRSRGADGSIAPTFGYIIELIK